MKTLTEINYDAVLGVAKEHATVLRSYLTSIASMPEQAIMSVAWAGALNAVYDVRSYAIACTAKWPIKTDEELGDEILAGRPLSGYFGYYATPEELALALTRREFPNQLHYCVGFLGSYILDPWCSEVVCDYEESSGKEWPSTLKLPRYVLGQSKDLRITKDYHYIVNEQISAGLNAVVSTLAHRL